MIWSPVVEQRSQWNGAVVKDLSSTRGEDKDVQEHGVAWRIVVRIDPSEYDFELSSESNGMIDLGEVLICSLGY